MSKSINLEIVSIQDEYAVLEAENGNEVVIDLEYLPENLVEVRYLRLVISHTDYNPDKEYEQLAGKEPEEKVFIPNGRKLS